MSLEELDADTEAATRRLRLLGEQADAVRAELSRLRSELAAARGEFSKLRATQLAETGAQLVVAAAHADTVAQSAMSSLDGLNLFNQLDELTGLPTRALLLDRLETAISLAQRRGSRVGLVFLDLDHFKQINDTLGHAVGDLVLQVAAQRLESVVRDSDTVSRHGGDEFVLLFPEITRSTDLRPLAETIVAVLSEPAELAGQTLRLSASVGIAVYPEDGNDAATLLGHADAAMYRSKKRGPGHFEFHAAALDGQADGAAETLPPPVALARRTDAMFAEHELHLRTLRGANHELLEAARIDQQMRAHAEQAHQRQINFVAMAAHAMRSPLSAISMTVSVLKRDPQAAMKLPQRLDKLEHQTRHLARLIDDLLDGSRVGGGEFKLDCTPLTLDAVLDAAVEASRPPLESKRQALQLRRSTVAAAVNGDAMRLTQLFANLLRNASRRAPDGGEIVFSARVEETCAVFTVADNGAAIEDEELGRIFELYALDKNLPFDDAGLGIGLAVVRELARAHEGEVVARNATPGSGAEFVVTLPCEPDAA
ncbi:MAG: diguanylate cyclase [Caldimonas sp.]